MCSGRVRENGLLITERFPGDVSTALEATEEEVAGGDCEGGGSLESLPVVLFELWVSGPGVLLPPGVPGGAGELGVEELKSAVDLIIATGLAIGAGGGGGNIALE